MKNLIYRTLDKIFSTISKKKEKKIRTEIMLDASLILFQMQENTTISLKM